MYASFPSSSSGLPVSLETFGGAELIGGILEWHLARHVGPALETPATTHNTSRVNGWIPDICSPARLFIRDFCQGLTFVHPLNYHPRHLFTHTFNIRVNKFWGNKWTNVRPWQKSLVNKRPGEQMVINGYMHKRLKPCFRNVGIKCLKGATAFST